MDIATLRDQEQRLVFDRFTEDTALALGAELVRLAQAAALPVVIDIRTPDRTLFHAALPGSAPLNDRWARRKSSTALAFQMASLRAGAEMREKGESLALHGLNTEDFADHGGSFPIRVAGAGVVAAVTVSGLPEVEDHALAVRAIEALLARG